MRKYQSRTIARPETIISAPYRNVKQCYITDMSDSIMRVYIARKCSAVMRLYRDAIMATTRNHDRDLNVSRQVIMS